jgi:hypothetical protein
LLSFGRRAGRCVAFGARGRTIGGSIPVIA